MAIRRANPAADALRTLIEAHRDQMFTLSPPESVHAMSADALSAPDITLWADWDGAVLRGCGALRELDGDCGEIKAMRTADGYLRQGVGRRILEHIIRIARRRGYKRLYLETGAGEDFAAALALYQGYGFETCDPFGDYQPDPNSVFMTLSIYVEPEPASPEDSEASDVLDDGSSTSSSPPVSR